MNTNTARTEPTVATLAHRLPLPHTSTVCDFKVKAYAEPRECNAVAAWSTNCYGVAAQLVHDLKHAGYGASVFNAANQAIG